jgi:DNA sulfur modification protein DndC
MLSIVVKMAKNTPNRKTAFDALGYKETISKVIQQTQELYLSDDIPWVLGYSGGKDSTAILQLVWKAIAALPKDKHIKPVHVISTDTLVENPIVAIWVKRSLTQMSQSAIDNDLPIKPHRLIPEVQNRFWVNLIGRGYPAPRPKFRWCTSRLKISPSNNFISKMVKTNGEAILILGTRKAESAARAANMKKYEQGSTRDLLSRNRELDRVWVYTPISEWHDDDVWQYLMQEKNPWGFTNEELLNMYQGATSDGECPLVVDTSTPSCGDSRFGCYVCTMVGEDKSMAAMIQNDEEKEWMLPLLELRTKWLDITDPNQEKKNKKIDLERKHRDFRRMNGSLTLHNDRLVHGPYKQEYRSKLLEAVLNAETAARELGPPEVKDLQLITMEDLEEIRRIWVMEKHEIEDLLPGIYEATRNKAYPGKRLEEGQLFKAEDIILLKEICNSQAADKEGLHYELIRDLLHIEHQNRTMVRRSKLFDALDKTLERCAFKTEAEALEFALSRQESRDSIDNRYEVDVAESLSLFEDAMNS